MMTRIAFAVAASLGVSMSACQNENMQDMDLKTLDNFAGSTFQWNSCSGGNPVLPSAVAEDQPHAASLKSALTSVPLAWQTRFFSTLGGKLEVTSDINASCNTPEEVTDGRRVTGTGLLFCISNQENGSPVAFIAANPGSPEETDRNIRHSVVRMLAEAINRSLGDGQEVQAMRADIAAAVLSDAAQNRSGNLSLEKFRGIVPDEVLIAGISDAARTKAYKEAPLDQRKLFETHAFAESFDSLYCSQASRNSLNTTFVATAASLKSAEAIVARASSDTAALSLTQSPYQPGFQNQYGWGGYSGYYAPTNYYQPAYQPQYRNPCLLSVPSRPGFQNMGTTSWQSWGRPC